MGFGLGSLYGIPISCPSSLGLIFHKPPCPWCTWTCQSWLQTQRPKMTCNGVPVNLVPGLVTLGLTEIRTADTLPMISHPVETSFIASVSVSGIFPLPSAAAPVLCWCRKCQHRDMETLIVPEYPPQLGCQTLTLQDPPRISPLTKAPNIYLENHSEELQCPINTDLQMST